MDTYDETDPSLSSTRPHRPITGDQVMPRDLPIMELPAIPQRPFNVVLVVTYVGGHSDEFETRRGPGAGWTWRYGKNPARLIIRPDGTGTPRVEIPLARIRRVDVGRRYVTGDEG